MKMYDAPRTVLVFQNRVFCFAGLVIFSLKEFANKIYVGREILKKYKILLVLS